MLYSSGSIVMVKFFWLLPLKTKRWERARMPGSSSKTLSYPMSDNHLPNSRGGCQQNKNPQNMSRNIHHKSTNRVLISRGRATRALPQVSPRGSQRSDRRPLWPRSIIHILSHGQECYAILKRTMQYTGIKACSRGKSRARTSLPPPNHA